VEELSQSWLPASHPSLSSSVSFLISSSDLLSRPTPTGGALHRTLRRRSSGDLADQGLFELLPHGLLPSFSAASSYVMAGIGVNGELAGHPPVSCEPPLCRLAGSGL
jgi:hypothetical protein